jgi:hypothetical protein
VYKIKLKYDTVFLKYWFSETYCYIVRVTIDGVRIGDSICWPLLHTIRDYALQITDTHRLVSSVYYILHTRFLATDFNTGTITVSLNYTLHISHMKCSLHSRTLATVSFTAPCTEVNWTDSVPRLCHLGTDHIENVSSIVASNCCIIKNLLLSKGNVFMDRCVSKVALYRVTA